MLARVEHVGVHRPTGLIYADVSYWQDTTTGNKPALRNDFLIQVGPSAKRVVTDPAGRIGTVSGKWLTPQVEVDGDWRPRRESPTDPWLRETNDLGQRAQVIDVIAAYGRRAAGTVGDNRGVDRGEVHATDDPALAALIGEQLAL
jgi:hypothetical protein